MKIPQPHPALTQREMAILELVAEGLSAKEVARTLGIMPRTIERHMDNARSKLKAKNRIHLVTLALREGAI